MWQKLYDELKSQSFIVLTVALESRGVEAARKFIERAAPTYPALIDADHLISEQFNLVNVPQALWIDERGKIVRPAEISGYAMSAKMPQIRKIYLDAIRAWVHHGEHTFTPAEARKRMPTFTSEIALAHTAFHLGLYLWHRADTPHHGDKQHRGDSHPELRREAKQFFDQALELNPDSWNFYRQIKNLEHPLASSGWSYFKRVWQFHRRGKPYYPLVDLPGVKKLFGKN